MTDNILHKIKNVFSNKDKKKQKTKKEHDILVEAIEHPVVKSPSDLVVIPKTDAQQNNKSYLGEQDFEEEPTTSKKDYKSVYKKYIKGLSTEPKSLYSSTNKEKPTQIFKKEKTIDNTLEKEQVVDNLQDPPKQNQTNLKPEQKTNTFEEINKKEKQISFTENQNSFENKKKDENKQSTNNKDEDNYEFLKKDESKIKPKLCPSTISSVIDCSLKLPISSSKSLSAKSIYSLTWSIEGTVVSSNFLLS